MFAGLKSNPEVWREAERFWQSVFEELVAEYGVDDWSPWIPRRYENGLPMDREDTPVFDSRSTSLSRAVRITLHEAVGDDLELAAWTKSYGEEFEAMPRHELFLNLGANQASIERSRRLLREWVSPDLDLDEFEASLAKWRLLN